MTPDLIITIVEKLGVPALGAIVTVYLVTHFFVPQWQKDTEDDKKAVNEYRNFMLEELRQMRIDAKEDRASVRSLIAEQNKTNAELRNTLEGVGRQLITLNGKVDDMDGEIKTVYELLGRKKGLIEQ